MEKRALIGKNKEGFHVLSERGRNLGGPYKTEEEARYRLKQVEYFKAKHKKASWVDKLEGGRADKKKPSDFPPKKFLQGLKHEKEHTKDLHIAAEIAMDHLTEDINYYDKIKKIEKTARGINMAMGNRRTAVIIEGNRSRGYSNKALDSFYQDISNHLRSLGFTVKRDPGLPYTSPPLADVWIGHSRGADRLRFAPKKTFTICVGGKQQQCNIIINHPLDTDLSREENIRSGKTNPYHVVYSHDMKQRIEQALDKHFSSRTKSAFYWPRGYNLPLLTNDGTQTGIDFKNSNYGYATNPNNLKRPNFSLKQRINHNLFGTPAGVGGHDVLFDSANKPRTLKFSKIWAKKDIDGGLSRDYAGGETKQFKANFKKRPTKVISSSPAVPDVIPTSTKSIAKVTSSVVPPAPAPTPSLNPKTDILKKGFNLAGRGLKATGRFMKANPRLSMLGGVIGGGALMHGMSQRTESSPVGTSQGFSGSKYASVEAALGLSLAVPIAYAHGTILRAPSMTAKSLIREHTVKLRKYNQAYEDKKNEHARKN